MPGGIRTHWKTAPFHGAPKQWAKRGEQIERVMQATVGMYGDLQGIAGKSLQEIEGMDLPALIDGTKE